MKILHVITTLDVGGAEMHLLSQVRGQTQRGHEVRVAYLKGEGTLVPDFREAGAVEVFRTGLGSGLFSLASQMRASDIVHSHLLKADMLCAVVATIALRRPRLLSGKHNDEHVLKKPLVSFIHGILGSLPARTVVLSDHVGRFIERHGRVAAKKIERVYYGIDPTPFEDAAARPASEHLALRESLGAGRDDIVFTCVARFAPQKAHDVLLRAFAAARAEWESRDESGELKLLLVGGDPFGDGVERARALAESLDLDRSVVFCGIRRDVPAIIGASDVFCMSSLWEGLGLVFLEAMAASKPVLATRVSAVPEVVVEGETGVLCEPASDESFRDGFLAMADDSARRLEMGRRGRERVSEIFGLDRMVDETLAIYRDVAGR